MTSSLDLIRGRQVVQTLTNQSGGGVIAGDVVIIDTANDESFTTTTTAAYTATQVCIALDSIAAAASGRVLLQGYAPLVNVSASATRGYYLFTHTVAKQATSSASFTAGAFGQVLKAGTTPSAYIFPPALSASIGVTRSGATTDGHVAVWNGSSADSIKDGGVLLTDGAWTDYTATSTVVGWGSFVTKEIYYKIVGKTVFVVCNLYGASNNTASSITLPVNMAAAPTFIDVLCYIQNNSGTPAAGLAELTASSNVLTFYATVAGGAWAASNNKQVHVAFTYPSA